MEGRKPEYPQKTHSDELQKMPHATVRRFKPQARLEPAQQHRWQARKADVLTVTSRIAQDGRRGYPKAMDMVNINSSSSNARRRRHSFERQLLSTAEPPGHQRAFPSDSHVSRLATSWSGQSWPCFSPGNIMEWAVLAMFLAWQHHGVGSLGHVSRLATSWSGQSWSRCWLFLAWQHHGVGSLGAGAGCFSPGNIMEWAVLAMFLAWQHHGVGSLGAGAGCFSPGNIMEWAVLEQVLAVSRLATSWSGQSWSRCWLFLAWQHHGVGSLGAGAGCFSPGNIMEWAVLEQVLASHWGCVSTTIPLATSWSGQSWSRCWLFLAWQHHGVGSLGAGAGCFSPGNIMEWAVLEQVLAVSRLATSWSGQSWSRCWLFLAWQHHGVGSLGAGAGCFSPGNIMEWAVLEQVLAVSRLATSWSGQSWSRCWLFLAWQHHGVGSLGAGAGCFSPGNIMEWAVLEQVLAVSRLATSWSGQSWSRCWPVIGAVSQGQRAMFLAWQHHGVGCLGAGAGQSLGLCHKDSEPCFSPGNIMEWAVLEQVLASHWGCVTRTASHVSRLATSWSGLSWSRCWPVIGAVSQGQRAMFLAWQHHGVGCLGAGAGQSLGLCHKDSEPCFSPGNIMEWAVLEQVLASHWGCVTRTASHVSRLATSWSGQSWSRCWPVIGAVSQGQRAMFLAWQHHGVGSLGAGAGQSLGLCHKDSEPCFSPGNIMEWAVLEQVLASHWGCVTRTASHVSRLATSWSGQSWSRCWPVIGAVSQGQRAMFLAWQHHGVGSLGAGAGQSLGLCHKDSEPCFSPGNIMEWAVLEQVLASHWGCVTRTAIRLASLELAVHMSIYSVVSCSQSNHDDLVSPFQVVVVICAVEVRVLLMSFSCCDRLDDGLVFFVGDRLVTLIKATYLLFC